MLINFKPAIYMLKFGLVFLIQSNLEKKLLLLKKVRRNIIPNY